jgi:hypothetical protein
VTEENKEPHPFADHPLVKLASEGQAVRAEWAGSPMWQTIMEGAQAEELEAMRDLADTNATDVNAIIACQIRIFAFRAVPGYVLAKIELGEQAARTLDEEDAQDAGVVDDEDWPR